MRFVLAEMVLRQYVGTSPRTGKLLGFNVVTETRSD